METWRESGSWHTLRLTQIHCPTHVSQIPPSTPLAHTRTHTCSSYVADACTDTNTHSLTFHQSTRHKTHASFHCITLQAPARPGSSGIIRANNCRAQFSQQIRKKLRPQRGDTVHHALHWSQIAAWSRLKPAFVFQIINKTHGRLTIPLVWCYISDPMRPKLILASIIIHFNLIGSKFLMYACLYSPGIICLQVD